MTSFRFHVVILISLSLLVLSVFAFSSSSSSHFLSQFQSKSDFPNLKSFLQCSSSSSSQLKNTSTSSSKSPTTPIISPAFFGDSLSRGIFFNPARSWWAVNPTKMYAYYLIKRRWKDPVAIEMLTKSPDNLFGNYIFAKGSSALAGNKAIKYLPSLEYRAALLKFVRDKKPLDVAFVLFGTNEGWKDHTNINKSLVKQVYSEFIERDLFTIMKAKEVVLLTPPPISEDCPPPHNYCKNIIHQRYRNDVVQGLREVGEEFSRSKTRKLRFMDFNKYMLEQSNLNELMDSDGFHLSFAGHEVLYNFIVSEGCK